MYAEQNHNRTCESCGESGLDVEPVTIDGETADYCPDCNIKEAIQKSAGD
jgi:hypothetical protein